MPLHALAFLAGILVVQQLAVLPALAWGWLLPPLGLLAVWKRFFLLPLFLVVGAFWVAVRADAVLQERIAPELEGVDLALEVVVADIPRPAEHGVRFVADVRRARRNGAAVAVPARVQLSVYGADLKLRVGDVWDLSARLRRPHGFQNPGGFDYEGHLFHQRIRAVGYVRATPPPQLRATDLAAYRLDRFRQDLSERIAALLPDNAFTGMLIAFANGDERGIADTQWQVLNRTGTIHLIAISGMNIGLVAGLVFFLLRWLWALPGRTVLLWPAPKVAAVGAMAAAFVYTALAGFAIPTQRALIMLAVVLGGVLVARRVSATTLLAAALLVVLLFDPLAVMAAGFWLSFAAVAVLVYAVQGRPGHGPWHRRWREWGRLQWAVAIGLLPLLLLFFQQTSISGPLANLIAIPAIELAVIPATLLAVAALLTLPDAVAGGLLQLAAWPLEMLWPMLEYLAGLEHSQWTQHLPVPWNFGCALVGVLLLLAPRGWPARWLGGVWLAPILLVRPALPAPGEAWITLLDVGQGLAAVVRTHGHTLVFDTGARFSARFDAGRAVVLPYLRAAGVARVDTLVVSHGDNDHIGGAASLRQGLPVARVLSSVPERLPDALACAAGTTWEWDGVTFRILHPAPGQAGAGNNTSCVLQVTGPYGRVLLPGDIEAPAEAALLAEFGSGLAARVLVVPHHGSKTSSTPAFIDTVRPEVALFPYGYRNRYRHPHPAVVARYIDSGARLYDSPAHGAIEVRLAPGAPPPSSYRETHRRYWFGQ